MKNNTHFNSSKIVNKKTIAIFMILVVTISVFINQFEGFGWGDALSFLAKCQTYNDCVWDYNGRISQQVGLLIVYLFAQFFSTPFEFPWNLFRITSLLIYVTIPIILYFAYKKVFHDKYSLTFIPILLILIFVSNSEIHILNSYFGLADFISYSFPIGIFGISLMYFYWLIKREPFYTLSLFHKIFFVFLIAFNCLLSEQHMTGVPVYIFTLLLLSTLTNDTKKQEYMKLGLLTAISLVISLYLYFTATGQLVRSQALDINILSLQNIENFFIFPVKGILTFFSYGNNYNHSMPNLLITSLFYYGFLIYFIWKLFIILRRKSFHNEKTLLIHSILTLYFLYHSLFSTLLISSYFPERAYLLPNLILIFLLSLIITYFLSIIPPGLKNKKVSLALNGILLIFTISSIPMERNISVYEVASKQAGFRKNLYQNISTNKDVTNYDRLILVNCPRGGQNGEFVMEADWGTEAISKMLFDKANFLALDQNYPADALDRNIFDCSTMQISKLTYKDFLDPKVTNQNWFYTPYSSVKTDEFKTNAYKVKVHGDHGRTLIAYPEFENVQAKWIEPEENIKHVFFYSTIVNIGQQSKVTLNCVGVSNFKVWLNGTFIGEGNWPALSTFSFIASDGDTLKIEVSSEYQPYLIARYYKDN